jgi:hypothetical protein
MMMMMMMMIPYFLDSWFTDDGGVVSFTGWQCSTPEKHVFSASGIHSARG